jgi:ATP phosphoribosyltransferase
VEKQLKLALPKGRLLEETAGLLHNAGWGLRGYHQVARSYRLKSTKFPDLVIKVFHEKDIPIQVAIGNYDLGVCGRDWIEELLVRYPGSALMKVKELGFGQSTLYMTASQSVGTSKVAEIQAKPGTIRIASEYPNLAESFAVARRMRRFSVFPIWGAAEVYPPESADLSLISLQSEKELDDYGLAAVSKILTSSAYLIANRNSWESKDMGRILASVCDNLAAWGSRLPPTGAVKMPSATHQHSIEPPAEDTVWFALPDGHQQMPTLHLLTEAGIKIGDYSASGRRRPTTGLAGVKIKVIRPQDMPLQVANGNFDLAITGRDWLMEHLYQFPSSPVTELLNLKFGKVKIVAVVSNGLAADDTQDLRQLSRERLVPLRVASEYVNIADKYARDNHLGWYRVVPTWGASEGFLPEDADLLIENTQTGQTLSRHNLKIVDTLFESTACLIGSTVGISNHTKSERIKSLIATIEKAAED